jgi:general stress protein 26
MDATDVEKKLLETLRSFETVMVTSKAENGTLHSRPMAVAEVGDGCEIWFATSRESGKVDELSDDTRCLVTGQEGRRYVSLSGRVDVVGDPERVRALWRPAWKAWFPEGKEDPSIVLLRLRPEIGEYWDDTGAKGVRHLFQMAKAVLNGRSAAATEHDARTHAKVPL